MYMAHGSTIFGVSDPARHHYDNMPMQYTANFNGFKNDNFLLILFLFFPIFAQNIDCGYTIIPTIYVSEQK